MKYEVRNSPTHKGLGHEYRKSIYWLDLQGAEHVPQVIVPLHPLSFTLQTFFVNVLSRASNCWKRMNAHLLSISMALPMLLLWAGQSFGNLQALSQGTLQPTRLPMKTSQVKLETQQPPPFFLSAKDDKQQKDECSWLGICGDTQK